MIDYINYILYCLAIYYHHVSYLINAYNSETSN